eukprot:315824-Rhodomonas_salina.7
MLFLGRGPCEALRRHIRFSCDLSLPDLTVPSVADTPSYFTFRTTSTAKKAPAPFSARCTEPLLLMTVRHLLAGVDVTEHALLGSRYRGRPFVPIEKAKRQRSFRQLDLKPPISTKKSIDPSLSSRGGKFFHNPRANSGLIRRRAST